MNRKHPAVTSLYLGMMMSLLLALAGRSALASNETLVSIDLGPDTEMELRTFPAAGTELIIGFPCDLGTGEAEAQAGEVLSKRGLEVWLADLLGAHFLPIAPSSMRSLEGEEVARVIEHAISTHPDKQIILTASGYGAIPALRGAQIWQQLHPDNKQLLGAILFFPVVSATTPQPGKPIQYLPVISQSRLPVVIMQPGNSPTRFWAKKLKRELEKGGSQVHIEILPKVRSRFYSRHDATADERAMSQRLPDLVEQAVNTLKQFEVTP